MSSKSNEHNIPIKLDQKVIGVIKMPKVLSFSSENDKVEDRLAGYLIINTNKKAEFLDEYDGQAKKLVIILESPHKDEFEFKEGSFNPQKAANGKTGDNIEKLIDSRKWVKKLDTGTYTIQLMNAIQFQMSCYNTILKPNDINKIDSTLRDEMFLKFWANDIIKTSFNERLSDYKPNVIVNACTKEFKENVQEAIDEVNINLKAKIFQDSHPCSWWMN